MTTNHRSLDSLNLFKGFLLLTVFCISIKNTFAETIGPHQYDEEVSIIPLRDNCSTIAPIKKYSIRDGEREGVFYTTVCFNGNSLPNALVDEFKYTFIDTGGTSLDRCYGTVDISTPSAVRHKWQFLGAVPGYTCNQTNQTVVRYHPKGY